MARGRMLNKTVAIDRRLNSLSLEAHWLYLMTIPHLDRDGLIAGDAPLLAAVAMPRRPELHAQTDAIVAEWITAGLVVRYTAPDTDVLFFAGFGKNQRLEYNKEAASDFPPPPGYQRTSAGLVASVAQPAPEPRQPAQEAPIDVLATNSGLGSELVASNSGVGSDESALKIKIKIKTNEREVEEQGEGESARIPRADGHGTRPSRQSSSDFGSVCTAYEQTLGLMLTPAVSDLLADLLERDKFPAAWITEAMQIALKAGRANLSYVEGVLKNWKSEGKHARAQKPRPGRNGMPGLEQDAASLKRRYGVPDAATPSAAELRKYRTPDAYEGVIES